MDNTKHTPGPWRIIRGSEYTDDVEDTAILSIEAANGRNVYYTDSGFFVPCEADATLIAAAPDLLAACEEAETAIYRLNGSDDLPGWISGVVVNLRAAIEKARGGAL